MQGNDNDYAGDARENGQILCWYKTVGGCIPSLETALDVSDDISLFGGETSFGTRGCPTPLTQMKGVWLGVLNVQSTTLKGPTRSGGMSSPEMDLATPS